MFKRMMDYNGKRMVIDPKGLKISGEDYVKLIIQAPHSLDHSAKYLNREHGFSNIYRSSKFENLGTQSVNGIWEKSADTRCRIDGLDQSTVNEGMCHYLDENVARLATLMANPHEVKPYVCIDSSSKLSCFVDLRELTLKKSEAPHTSTVPMVDKKMLVLQVESVHATRIVSGLFSNAENVGALDCSLPTSEVLQSKYACHLLDGEVVISAILMSNIHEMKPCGCIDGSFIDLRKSTLKMLETWIFPRVAIFENIFLSLVETGDHALFSSDYQLPTKILQEKAEWGLSTRHILQGHWGPVFRVLWIPSDELLLTNAPGEVLMVWDVCTEECSYEISERPETVGREPLIVDISTTPNGGKQCPEGKIAILHIHKERATMVACFVTEDSESLILNLNIHRMAQIHVWGVGQDIVWLIAGHRRSNIAVSHSCFGGISRQWKRGLKGVQMNTLSA